MFGAVIGGLITVVLLKSWEKKHATGKKSDKQPTEHDERYWQLQQVGELKINLKKIEGWIIDCKSFK